MATVRTAKRGGRAYRYLVQSYRWEGAVRRKELYLGTEVPPNLEPYRMALEKSIWAETWFPHFDAIKSGFLGRQAKLPPSIRQKEAEDFALHFTYDTNRIEGSTLSLDDTRHLLERGITPATKPITDVLETQAHAALVRRLVERPEPVDLAHLLRWHKELFGQTKPEIAGRLRDYQVRILGSRHIPPTALEVRPMMLELIRWTKRSAETVHPVQLAGEFHFRFENIHPFGDGNGRIGRLALNAVLQGGGFPMINISYLRRGGYYHALEASSVAGDSRPFLHWLFLRYSRDMRFFLEP